ncbi:MFS transporter [Apiospora phragmitis]|uniref:MFS transporter n=1 Tax=Apiospora phragmitis TaxID=2905665 RepID=A0ABR1SVG5_9PEZI
MDSAKASQIDQVVENSPKKTSLDAKVRDDGEDGLHTVTTTGVGDTIASTDYTEEQYNKLTKKIDRYLIPIMYVASFAVKSRPHDWLNKLFGLTDDLGLHGQQYQWLTTIFYMTYLIGEFPSTWLLQKCKAGPCCLLLISACNNWSGLLALRALQGFFECNITPGFLLITGAWYRTTEHASRSLLWQTSQGLLSIVCNLILYGIARRVAAVGGIEPWRCITLFLAALTLLGAVWCWFVLGTPNEVRWLNEEEKRMACALGEDSTGKRWRGPRSEISSNVAGRTKKTVVSSLTLIAYCGGNMAGAQVFQTKDAPRYLAGTITCSACFGGQIIVIALWMLWYMYENRPRDREAAAAGISKEKQERLGRELGEADKTDRENPHFRYAL